MAIASLEERVAALEAEVARLKRQMQGNASADKPRWEQIYGTFANDPIFDEAMRLGREYRESLRPAADEPDDSEDVSA
jgi:hypothetical protein